MPAALQSLSLRSYSRIPPGKTDQGLGRSTVGPILTLSVSAIILSILPVAALAQDSQGRKLQFSAGVSISGIQIEAAYRFRPKWGVRAFAGGGLRVFGDGEVAGIDYDWDVNLGGYGLLADYFPFGDRFRISGGIFLPSTRATGKANGDLEIGESFFEGVELSGDVEPVDDILPLVSVGYLQPLWESVYLTADVGVIFTNGFTVDLRRSGGPMVPSEELEQEESQFRAKAWDVFPFLAFGLAYRF